MKHSLRCPSCGDEITVDLNSEFRQVRCPECGQYIDMLKVRKGRVFSKRKLRNNDMPARKMGNGKIFKDAPDRAVQIKREKALIVASFPVWDEKLKLVQHPDARSWLASLLWNQLYSEIPEINQISRAAWRPYLLRGAGEISTDEFLSEVAVVGIDKRILTMQCRGVVSFPEHLRP